MRLELVALLVGLLDGYGSAHATRPRSALLSELAFAAPPLPSARLSPDGAWTGRSPGAFPPAGRYRVCQLTTARGGKRPTKIATAAAARGASVRIEPLDGRNTGSSTSTSTSTGGKVRRSSSKGDSSNRVQPSAAASQKQQKPKRARSPTRKQAASAVAAATADVDPFPTGGSEFVAPLTGHGGVSSGAAAGTSSKAVEAEAMATARKRASARAAADATSRSASASPYAKRKGASKASPGRGRPSAAGKANRYSRSGRSGSGSGSATKPKATKQRYGDVSAKRVKALRTGGRAFFIVCDAESMTFPELVESIDMLDELGTRDVGVIYADWEKAPDWCSDLFGRSKARGFKLQHRDPLPPGSNPLGDDTMTADLVALARSKEFKKKKYEFCLVSADGSLAGLAARLRDEGAVVRGVGRRQAPDEFLQNCDDFMYIDPANRFELLDNEGLVISVALCIALAAAGLERCDWVRMKTIVNSLHAWDLGLESPNYFGYSDYDEVVHAMDAYVTGIEDTSGEVVVKVPPKPKAGEVPRGLEDVATYLFQKWVSFTKDPQMNDILLACIPACLQALSAAREETNLAVRRFQRRDGWSLYGLD
eukprot:g13273.t1